MICRSADPYADFMRNEREIEASEKMLPKCSFCGATITTDEYHHFRLHGLEYIICDDCLEEDPVDNYMMMQDVGGQL